MAVRDIKCIECGETIVTEIKLAHTGGMGPQEKTYSCPICEKEIETYETIKDSRGKVVIK